MNTKTRILAAFAVATLAGTILGLLLNSPGKVQSKLTNRIAGEKETLWEKLFGKRAYSAMSAQKNAQEIEQA